MRNGFTTVSSTVRLEDFDAPSSLSARRDTALAGKDIDSLGVESLSISSCATHRFMTRTIVRSLADIAHAKRVVQAARPPSDSAFASTITN